jgi:hypothetical protein
MDNSLYLIVLMKAANHQAKVYSSNKIYRYLNNLDAFRVIQTVLLTKEVKNC